MVANAVRIGLTVAFAVAAIVVFNTYAGDADDVAKTIAEDAESNELLSESAIQQQVVAAWATRDAELAQIKQNGVRNGLLGVCAAMLVSIAVNTALRERRDLRTEASGTAEVPPLTAG